MPFKPIRTFRHLQNRFCPFSYQYTSVSDYRFLIKKINLYFKLNPGKKAAYRAELDYLNQHSNPDKSVTMVWPYPFVKSYEAKNIDVFKDAANGLFYVLQNGRKLYYSRKYNTVEAVQESYNSLVVEQHPNSPHLYLKQGFEVAEGDFVMDIGAAEGNFSLDVVETAGKIIIVEAEEHWIEALKATFEPWKDKVEIIHKYISDTNDSRCATLKSLVGETPVDFLKLDVEGAEMSILNSSAELLRRKQIRKLAVCTYHKKKDEHLFGQLLKGYGYDFSQTPGVMLFVYGQLTPPYFRKVLIQAIAHS
jgi:hypothetical protein